jgi:hypothetical protein
VVGATQVLEADVADQTLEATGVGSEEDQIWVTESVTAAEAATLDQT